MIPTIQRRPRPTSHSQRPQLLEPLEARIAPAAVSWTGNINNDWNTAGNWSGGAVPGTLDDVTIDVAGAATVFHTSGAHSVASLTVIGNDALLISGGSVSVLNPSTIANLDLSAGTFNGGPLTTLTGSSTFSGEGTLQGVVRVTGAAAITSGSPNVLGRLEIAGTLNQGDAYLDFNSAGVAEVRVLAGGVYDTANPANGWSLRNFGSLGLFIDAGATFRHSGAGTFSLSGVPLHVNGGTLDVDASTLQLNAAGSLVNATFDVATGATLSLDGINSTVGGTLTGVGAGTVRFGGGTLTSPAGAQLAFASGMFSWGGEASLEGTQFTNTGFIQVDDGSPNLRTELRNAGTIVHRNAYLDFNSANAELRVLSGGVYNTVNTANGWALRNFGSIGITVEGGGTFRHTGTGTFNSGGVPFRVVGGTVDVQNSTLQLNSGGIYSTASYNVAAGATLLLDSTSAGVNGTLTGTGPGTVRFGSGVLTMLLDATFNFPQGQFSWGGEATVEGGNLTNIGFIQVADGSPNVRLKLLNSGTIVQGNAYLDFNADNSELRVLTGGVYDAANPANGWGFRRFAGIGLTVESGGVFRHSGAGSFSTNNLPFSVAGGVVDVQIGVLQLNSPGALTDATLNVALAAQLLLDGTNAKVNGALVGTGAGSVRFGAGTLTMGTEARLLFPTGQFSWGGEASFQGGPVTNSGFIQVSDGSPNIRTILLNAGTVVHGNAYLDFNEGTQAELRIIAGGIYDAANSTDGWAFRNFGAVGVTVEAGGVLRHTGSGRFLTSGVPFNVSGGTVEVQNGILQLNSGGVFGAATFNVAAGKQLSLDGTSATVNGILSGGGTGTVRFGGGTLHMGANASFAFPSGQFSWGGEASFEGNPLKNTGFIQINDGSPNIRVNMLNSGTIVNGNAFFDFNSANAELRVLPGGVFESANSANGWGFRNFGAVGITVESGGTWRHSGAGQYLLGGVPFSNGGTLEVLNSSVNLNGPVSNLVSGTLTGGTWKMSNGASLIFPATVTTNRAVLELSGSVSAPTVQSITTNHGALSLLGGRDLTVSAGFTNHGTLTLGPGSVLTAPTFTQSSTGTLNIRIGGPAAADIGRVATSGASTFGGTLNLALAGNFQPVAAATYSAMTYGSQSGAFAKITGLNLGQQNAFEVVTDATSLRVNSLINASDLAVTALTIPGSGLAGQNVAISYTVQNTGLFATAAGTWVDSIYLSRDGILDASDVLIQRITHTGVLAQGASYTENLSVPLPGALPADYRVFVHADSRGFVPDADRADNRFASAGFLSLDIPQLSEGVPFAGTIANGQELFFRVTMPADKGRTFTVSTTNGEADLAVQLGAVPGRFAGDGFSAAYGAAPAVLLPGGSVGEFFLRLHGNANAGAGTPFTLLADALDLGISALGTSHGANIGTVTTTITGTEFSPHTQFSLAPAAGGSAIAASKVVFKDSNTVFVTFDLIGAPLGGYHVQATDGLASTTKQNAFTVSTGVAGTLDYSISSPRFIRPTFRGVSATLTYKNTGDTDIPAPYFSVFSKNAMVAFSDEVGFSSNALGFGIMGVNPDGLAGVLPPGASGTIEILFTPINSAPLQDVDFEVQVSDSNDEPLDWSLLKDDFRPQGMPTGAWDVVFSNFRAEVGDRFDRFYGALVENANYLSQFGRVGGSIMRLLGLELEQADDFGAISARWQQSSLGLGNEAPFSQHLEFDTVGNATFVTGNTLRGFVATTSGNSTTYAGVGGDETGILARNSDGTFVLTENSGLKLGFLANGKLSFVEDTNGTRKMGGYTSGLLTSITDGATGDVTTFGYDAGGRIIAITDPVGRTTANTFDTQGRLVSSTTAQGTTSYTYFGGSDAAKQNAVTSITSPDGVVTTFTYDENGRLASTTKGSGPSAVTRTFAYDSTGKLTTLDSDGNATQVFRVSDGQVARSIDPLGNITQTSFDAFGRIQSLTDANGAAFNTTTGANGLPAGFDGPGQNPVKFAFAANTRLTGITGPGGDSILFGYDVKGNLTSTTFPDGTGDILSYDSLGRITSQMDANGIVATYTYTAAGLVDRVDFSDGTFVDYGYDAHRNLTTATDDEGTTTFTYDAADRILSVSYPNATSVTFTYNASGQRDTITDHTGFSVQYEYDTLGRLKRIADSADNTLTIYTYNSLGQLTSETRGNGTTTSYSYDDAGYTASIVHRDPSSAVIDEFQYTYDAIGRVATVTTPAGTTTYGYDFAGQLVSATMPGRTITYTYDADGNRNAVIDNAISTTYSINNLEQYVSAGSETLSYDRAGRLVLRTENGESTSLQYDAQGRLLTVVTKDGTTRYDYDALGFRIGITENGVRSDFAYDPSGLGTVFGIYGSSTTHFASGLGLTAAIGTGGASYFHFDATGNASALTGTGGSIQNTYTYLPFGELAAQTGAIANRFTFNARFGVQDDGGGQFYMRARIYDSELGRFTSRDPDGAGAGDTNLYRYVNNDPVNKTDPAGTTGFPLGPAGVGITGLGPSLINPTGMTAGQIYQTLAQGGSVPGLSSPNIGPAGAVRNVVLKQAGVGPANALRNTGALVQNVGNGGRLLTAGEALGPLMIAGVVGYGTGTVIDQVTEYTNPELKQQFREDLGYGFNLNPDGHGLNENYNVTDGRYNEFVRESGQDPLVADLYKRFIDNSTDAEEALRDAQRYANKLRREYPDLFPPVKKTKSTTVRPGDPNNIVGPSGLGADTILGDVFIQPVRYDGFVNGANTFGYTILFENMPTATAPAQVVTVTQTLDADLDVSTFQLGSFGWGNFKVTAPTGLQNWETRVDAIATLGIYVDVDASFSPVTRLLTVTYTSIDPLSGDVPDNPFLGFLPPNMTTPQGDGFATYTVAPKSGLTNGTRFDAVATIVFDTEAPINTPAVHNLLDNVAPVSAVTPFGVATTSRTKFRVDWTAADEVGGSGLIGTTIYYRDNGGPLNALTIADASNAVLFSGGEVGHTYTFYSRALDGVSNEEAISAAPDATITVVAPLLISNKEANGKLRTFTDSDGDTYTVALTGDGNLNVVLFDPDGDGKGPIDQIFLTGSTAKTKVTVSVKQAKDGPDADKIPDGDGIVTIGDLNVTGDLSSFTAKASDVIVDGIIVTGSLGSVTVRDLATADALVAKPAITGGGTVASKLKFALNSRNLTDGTLITVGNNASAIKAASIGEGIITAPSLALLSTSVGALNADLVIGGALGAISIKLGANSGNWSAGSFNSVTLGAALEADISSGGGVGAITLKAGSILGDINALGKITGIAVKAGAIAGQITSDTIGAVSITGGDLSGSIGSSAAPGKTKGLASLAITGGNLSGSVLVAGNAGAITVKENSKTNTGGNISGPVTANSFAAVTLVGGTLGGVLTATGTAASLGKALALSALNVTGGDILGDVRLLGGSGSISVKADQAGNGGNLTNVNITAAKIAALTVGRDVTNSKIFAGADLGADHELGGGDDTFGAGTIGAVNIGSKVGTTTFGNVVNSVIAAGLSTTNAILKDSDDTIFGVLPADKLKNTIAGLIIKGTADAASYFAAGKFSGKPKINNTVIPDLAADDRFLSA